MQKFTSMLESIMEVANSSQTTPFNDSVHPWLKQHMQLVYKYYTNEKFRENVTEGFLKLPNEIFMKSDERAERYRKTGNDLYKKDEYKEALKEYNESVAVASWESRPSENINTELALAFSNRSMCLIKLKQYKAALSDIDLALMQSPTEQLKKKLSFRRNECTGHISISKSANSKTHSESKVTWKDSSVYVASDTLEKLDLVIEERPELSLLKKDFYFTRCFNCFKLLELIIPCRGCNQVKFCSYACSVEAWESGHHQFCLFLTLFDHLTNKEIFKVPPLLACQLVFQLDLPSIFISAREGQLPGDLENVCPTTINDLDRLDKMAETAAHLLTYFTVIKRIPTKNDSVSWKYDIELFGGLLLMYLRKVEQMGRTVTSTELAKPLDEEEFNYLDDKAIGFAIYNQVKKLPHHCNPNVAIDIFNGQTIRLRAVKQIEKGEPIQLDFGDINCKMFTVKERSAFLSNLGYECNCDACVHQVQSKVKAFLCPRCTGPVLIEDDVRCLQCNTTDVLERSEVLTELDSCLYDYRQANLSLIHRERDVIKAEDYLMNCYRRLMKICYPTNHHLIDIFDRLSYCYKKMRKYKLSLIYAQKAVNCSDEAYHVFHKSRINYFFSLLDRQRNFLVWCAKRDKKNEPEFAEIFTETKLLMTFNLNQAHHLIESIGFKKDYYQSIINTIQKDLSQYKM